MLVVWDDEALSDLESIGAFIEIDNPAAARRVVERIQRIASLLETSPRLGRPAIGRPGVRELTVSRYPYVLVYELIEDDVQILAVVHQSQDRS
jgi:addiction module RelE/StbE family toxin